MEVESAVLDVEQPRVLIELIGSDRDAGLGGGEVHHRAYPLGPLCRDRIPHLLVALARVLDLARSLVESRDGILRPTLYLTHFIVSPSPLVPYKPPALLMYEAKVFVVLSGESLRVGEVG
jgi:hypothetical protein